MDKRAFEISGHRLKGRSRPSPSPRPWGAWPSARANTVYGINTTITSANPTGNPLQTDSVIGSITTDGTIGVIAPNDILAWNLQLIDGLDATQDVTLTNANSLLVEDTGNALTASATGLSFDFSGSGEFLIQISPYSGYQYFCFSTGGACLAGETIAPGDVSEDGVVLTGDAAPIGTQPLDGSPSAVPEPGCSRCSPSAWRAWAWRGGARSRVDALMH